MNNRRQSLIFFGIIFLLIGIGLFILSLNNLLNIVKYKINAYAIDGVVVDIRSMNSENEIVVFCPNIDSKDCIHLQRKKNEYQKGERVTLYFNDRVVAVKNILVKDAISIFCFSLITLFIGFVLIKYNYQIQTAFDRGDVEIGGI